MRYHKELDRYIANSDLWDEIRLDNTQRQQFYWEEPAKKEPIPGPSFP